MITNLNHTAINHDPKAPLIDYRVCFDWGRWSNPPKQAETPANLYPYTIRDFTGDRVPFNQHVWIIPPQDAAIVEPPKAGTTVTTVLGFIHPDVKEKLAAGGIGMPEPVNTVDEWLPVTSGIIGKGDEIDFHDNKGWVKAVGLIGGETHECITVRRRNPHYKPPFVPRVAEWPDVKPGAVLIYQFYTPSGETGEVVREITSIWHDGDGYDCIETDDSGKRNKDYRRDTFGNLRWTLIQPAPIDSSEAKK